MFFFQEDKCFAHFPSMVSERKKHEFVVNKKRRATNTRGELNRQAHKMVRLERNQKFITEKINIHKMVQLERNQKINIHC